MVKMTLKANGVNLAPFVERDSYSTTLTPVFSKRITSLDKVDHMILIRQRGKVRFKLNPQDAETAAKIANAIMQSPVVTVYHCLQRNQDVVADMVPSPQSADYLSRCLYKGLDWQAAGEITMEEL